MDVGSQDKALQNRKHAPFDLHTGSKCHKCAPTLEMGNDIGKFFGGACATPTAVSGERHPNSAASSTDQMQAPVGRGGLYVLNKCMVLMISWHQTMIMVRRWGPQVCTQTGAEDFDTHHAESMYHVDK